MSIILNNMILLFCLIGPEFCWDNTICWRRPHVCRSWATFLAPNAHMHSAQERWPMICRETPHRHLGSVPSVFIGDGSSTPYTFTSTSIIKLRSLFVFFCFDFQISGTSIEYSEPEDIGSHSIPKYSRILYEKKLGIGTYVRKFTSMKLFYFEVDRGRIMI